MLEHTIQILNEVERSGCVYLHFDSTDILLDRAIEILNKTSNSPYYAFYQTYVVNFVMYLDAIRALMYAKILELLGYEVDTSRIFMKELIVRKPHR